MSYVPFPGQSGNKVRTMVKQWPRIWQRMPKYKVASYPYSVSCMERGNKSGNEAKYKVWTKSWQSIACAGKTMTG